MVRFAAAGARCSRWQVKVRDLVYPKPTLVVHFQEGFGIKAGDYLKYRGIVVGDIIDAVLEHSATSDSIRVEVVLKPTAHHLCRQGSQFWIVRPMLGIGQINGIDTFANGVYMAVEPATPSSTVVVKEFVGRESPPAQEIRSPAGLQIVVESPERKGLDPGAPVRFRGFTVGHVMEVALAGDSGTVDARVYIQPDYKKLIRVNTQFWTSGGMNASAKLFDFSTWSPNFKMDMTHSPRSCPAAWRFPRRRNRAPRCLPGIGSNWPRRRMWRRRKRNGWLGSLILKLAPRKPPSRRARQAAFRRLCP